MSRRVVSVVLLTVMAAHPLLAGTGYSNVIRPTAGDVAEREPRPTPAPIVEVSDDVEGFRLQMLDFLHQLDAVLVKASKHPRIADKLVPELNGQGLRIPLSAETYCVVELADAEQMERMRQIVLLAPGLLSTPAVLESALAVLPGPAGPEGELRLDKASCTDANFDAIAEFNANVVGKTAILNAVKRTRNAIGLALSIANTINDAMDAATGECEFIPLACPQVPTSWIQTIFVIIAGVIDIVTVPFDLAAAEVEFQIVDAERCINFCTPQGFTERHRTDTAMGLAERGCDNRDNNCSNGIDEIAEDLFAPTVTVSPSVSARCYDNEQAARAAVDLAGHFTDDCSAVTETVTFTRAACTATAVYEAMDVAGNMDMKSVVLTIDEDPPTITLPTLAACYDTLAEATGEFGSAAIDDCTQLRSNLTAVEKECVADMELEVLDACDNRSVARASVRVDDTPPEVKIQALKLPSVDGLSCFGSEDDAVAAVGEATEFSDNCSSIENLMPTTTASGPACDLVVTSRAEDQCGRSTSDSLTVRVDAERPTISCSVDKEILWPANGNLVDVGFQLNLTDNCDGAATDFDVFVTSDEPTAFNLRVMGESDAHPDAVVERAGDGSIRAIRLRAQRRNTEADDGRVYRIRVVATDSCGLQSHADCFVTVPMVFSRGGRADVKNSGQFYDATETN